MMSFAIIKNCPIPDNVGKVGAPVKYPFSRMEVGDGFDAPRDMGQSGKIDKRQRTINYAAQAYIRRTNSAARFTTLLIDENTVRCVRYV